MLQPTCGLAHVEGAQAPQDRQVGLSLNRLFPNESGSEYAKYSSEYCAEASPHETHCPSGRCGRPERRGYGLCEEANPPSRRHSSERS